MRTLIFTMLLFFVFAGVSSNAFSQTQVELSVIKRFSEIVTCNAAGGGWRFSLGDIACRKRSGLHALSIDPREYEKEKLPSFGVIRDPVSFTHKRSDWLSRDRRRQTTFFC